MAARLAFLFALCGLVASVDITIERPATAGGTPIVSITPAATASKTVECRTQTTNYQATDNAETLENL